MRFCKGIASTIGLWILFAATGFAQDASVSVTAVPSDGVISSNGLDESGELYLYFDIDVTVSTDYKITVLGSGLEIPSPRSITGVAGVDIEERFGPIRTAGASDPVALRAEVEYKPVTTASAVTTVAVSSIVSVVVDGVLPRSTQSISKIDNNGSVILGFDFVSATSTSTDTANNIETLEILYFQTETEVSFAEELTQDEDGLADKLTVTEVTEALGNVSSTTVSFASYLNSGRTVTLSDLENGKQYWITVSAFDHADQESGIAFEDGAPIAVYANPQTTVGFGGDVYDRCFVVTASLGDRSSPALLPYRWVRDNVLMKFELGQEFVSWYYREGPRGSQWLLDHPFARSVAFWFVWFGAGFLLLVPLLVCVAPLLILRSKASVLLVAVVFFGSFDLSQAEGKLRPEDKITGFSNTLWFAIQGYQPFMDQRESAVRPADRSARRKSYERQFTAQPNVFGPSARSLMFRVGSTWDFLRRAGILGLSTELGFWTREGSVLDAQFNPVVPNTEGYEPVTGQTDRMTVLPVSVGLQYRFEYLFPQYVVPVFEGGLVAYAFLLSERGTQNVVYGPYWKAELRLALSWMDRSTAENGKFVHGIEETYLSFGYRADYANKSGKAVPIDFDLGHREFFGSIAFEF